MNPRWSWPGGARIEAGMGGGGNEVGEGLGGLTAHQHPLMLLRSVWSDVDLFAVLVLSFGTFGLLTMSTVLVSEVAGKVQT